MSEERPLFVGDEVPIPEILKWDALWKLLASGTASSEDQRFAAGWIATLITKEKAA